MRKQTLILGVAAVCVAAALGYGVYALARRAELSRQPLRSVGEIRLLLEDGRADEAERACRRRLLDHAEEEEAQLLWAQALEALGNLHRAEKILSELTDGKDTPSLLAHLHLGRMHFQSNRVPDAVRELQHFKKKSRDRESGPEIREGLTTASSLLGEIYLEYTKEYRKAAAEFKFLAQEDPENWEARYALGTAYAYARQYASAFKEFDAVMKGAPGTDIARFAESAVQYVREKRHPEQSRYLLADS